MATNSSNSLIMDAMADISGGSTADSEQSGSEVLSEGSYNSSDSVDDGDETETGEEEAGTENSADSSNPAPDKTGSSSKSASGSKKISGEKEVITVSDGSSKKQLEIDYTNREAIKKAFELAHGARKWQADRDKTIASEKALREKYTSDRRVLDALEQAFQEKGELGVIDLISGKPGASAEFIQRQVNRARFLESATPEEVAQLQQKEELEALKRDVNKHKMEQEAREQRIQKEREASEVNALQSRVNPAFEKYRFDGKLGDDEDEQFYDDLLWDTTMKRLAPYEEKGMELSRELVDKTFRDVATRLRNRIGGSAEKQASNIVAQKKQEAIENVQASATSAYKKGGVRAEAEDLISKGNFKSLFSQWGKFGK